MTAALAIALLAPQAAAPVAPTLPIGTSPEFAKAVLAVEGRLVDGDMAGARAAARALPIRAPRLTWADDAILPSNLRAERAQGLTDALMRWNKIARDFKPIVADNGAADITIGLAPTLPDGSDGLPLPTRVDSATPFRATIGLTRGKPGVPLRPVEMNMEIAYAIGRYLGVPDAPLPGSSMYRDGHPGLATYWPTPMESTLAARNLDLADRMRAAAEAGKPLGLALPTVRLAKERLDLGSIDQGKLLRGEIEVENAGAGALSYTVVRDCDCFRPIPSGQIPPQGRRTVGFTIETQEYVGRRDKMLLFESNDPARPTIELPVTFFSRPAYRLLHPGGSRVTASAGGQEYDYFFFAPPESPVHVVTAHWDGMAAKVTWEPWSGALADPELGEGPLPRNGWRFRVQVPASLPAGRSSGSLTVETDSRLFHTAMDTLYVQKGIVADEANLGDLVPGSRGSLLIDRPNAPFKILHVDAGPLKATVVDRRSGWEYRIDLEYRGHAPQGDFLTPVRIRTDDPKQPVVETLARGFVK